MYLIIFKSNMLKFNDSSAALGPPWMQGHYLWRWRYPWFLGVRGWYLGPSKDHYCCDLYNVIETCAYCVSGLMELFPQHWQMPNLTPHQHLQALTDKLTQATTLANQTTNGRQLIKYLGKQSNVCQTLSSSSRNKGQRRHCSCEYRQRNKGWLRTPQQSLFLA